MRHIALQIFKLLLLLAIFMTCTEDPAGPDISDDLKPKGTITGWIYNKQGTPLKDVLVSIDSDSATPCMSDVSGMFKVGRVLPGTYTLHFSHLEFEDNPSYTVTVEQGVDDTLDETVYLSYRYFILKGRITFGGSPVVMAGVVIDNLCISTLTNSEGLYIFNKVLKESEFKLISSKTDIGYGSISGIIGVPNDTTIVPDIELINEGGTVKGTVFDTLGEPFPFAIVHSVGGGLIDTANACGSYTITNMPCHELNIPIYVPEINGLTGAVSGLDVDENGTLTGINIYLHKASDYVNGMKIITSDIIVPDTVTKVDISVIGSTDGSAYIVEYEWYLGGATSPDTITQTSYFTLSLQRLMRLFSYKAINDTDILVEVRAKNNNDLYSQKEKFFLKLRVIEPTIDAEVTIHPDSSGIDTITANVNQIVYFKTSTTVLFGGIDTLEWNFGDGTVKNISPDSLAVTPYSYKDTGLYNAIFRLKEINGREAKDTVIINVDSGVSPPNITVDPQPATVLVGQTATFGVIATGTKPFTYEWWRWEVDSLTGDTSGNIITGATDSAYTTPATTINDSGTLFNCIVSNSVGSDTSTAALLKVTSAQTVNISGQVTDDKNSQPIVGASVKLEKGGQTATSGSDGTFTLTGTVDLAKQVSNYGPINDVIAVTNAGYLNYRVIVTNSDTSGIEIKMILCETVTDADGNVYQAVRIGNQVWTVENLRTTQYNDNTPIFHAIDSATWANDTTGAYCYYNNTTDADSIEKFGALYNWHAVNTGKLAPAGWHVPDSLEWDTLQNYLIANGYNWDSTTTGNKIAKSLSAKADWPLSTIAGAIGNNLAKNNSSGFTALPGGFRLNNGNFNDLGSYSHWWSASEYDASQAYRRFLWYYDRVDLGRWTNIKSCGFSVRLVRD